ncbi:restriction endonuclease subunit S [Lactiplantibacillus plantarum]|uniref:restriction endonuclease subunit S n=1 Tax=Lactiplantibacillus plantarum TaxID=1590 RepID=UPI0039A1AA3A
MKDNQAKYPQLRFKGFTDPWVQRQVGDFLTESRIPGSNGAISKKLTVKLWGKGVIPKETVTDGSEATKYYVRKAGQFMYGKLDFLHAAFGIVPENLDGYESTLDSPAFDIANLNSTFLMDTVMRKSFYLYQGNIANGSRKAKRIHVDTFSDMPIDVPTLDEQDKIGYFFDQLDNLIAANQRKLDLLKEQKKGYLQKMFPKNGAKVPELRFAGFADAWEERKLGDAVSISSGVTGDATLQDGEYRLTRIESISQGMLNVARLGFTNEKPDQKYLLNLGDILYSNINSLSHIGKVALVDTAGIYHGINLLRFQMRNDVDSEFLFQRLNTMPMKSWAVSHANPAVSQASINQTELSKQPISSPTITEQQKIGSFFKQLDDTIALHQRKLEKLQELKKGYLQKMFC